MLCHTPATPGLPTRAVRGPPGDGIGHPGPDKTSLWSSPVVWLAADRWAATIQLGDSGGLSLPTWFVANQTVGSESLSYSALDGRPIPKGDPVG